jgi:hypothetical protein
MSKFNTPTKPAVHGPITTERTPSGTTHEGAPGFAHDSKSELFLLAVSNMVGEKAFYETAGARDERFERLVHEVAIADAGWMLGFIGWLRGEANMRSASLVAAAESVKARLDAAKLGEIGNGARNRQLINAALQRADEPGELLAYWTSRHGRAIPKPVKRGVGDAVRRLYNEYGLLKYDTASKGFRFADVIDLVHPDAVAPWQGELFSYALDRRHGRGGEITGLPMVDAQMFVRSEFGRNPEILLDADKLKAAGMTWEDALSLAGSRVDKAELWAALIPSMGYMALLRNLRNFDEAGVSDFAASHVAGKLADPEQVKRSRQLPMRFLSAYRAAPSLRWAYPLERALGHCLASIPELPGRTLILIDTSSSMNETFSKDGSLKRWDAAVIFGVALALRSANADVVSFSSAQRYWGDQPGANTKTFGLKPAESLLRSIERWTADGYFLGGGTDTAGALRKHYDGHDRVVIVTDEQVGTSPTEVSASMPANRPLYTWNLAGYAHGHAPTGLNRWAFGGLSDQGFKMIPLLESGRNGAWPWLAER